MKTLTFNDLVNLPKLSNKEIEDALNYVNKDFTDCPKQTSSELSKFKKLKDCNPAFYKALCDLEGN